MDINSFQIIFDIILKSIQKRRTTLINQLVRAHDEVLSEIAREGRIVKKKAIIQKNGGVLGAFFSSNVPRFRSVHCRVRYDNYWMTLRQPGNEHLYFESFRMSSTSFQLLCKTLEPLLKPEEITEHVRPPLPIEKQVAVAVYKLASCAEYRVVGDVFGVHKSTVHKYFHRVVEAIVQLKNEFIKFPDLEKCLGVASAFEKTTHIPNIIGAIDGTHIPILPPSEGYLDYINRKGWPSIVMQGVVDNQYMFTDVSVKLPGSSHDATVFKESDLFQRSSELIPQYTKSFNGMEIPLFLVGDPAYPLLPWLLKPFTGCLTPDEESFNCYLSTGRIVIENAFGRLKGRWRCLGKRIDVHPSFVPQVVLACAILHNFVEKQKETYLDAWSYSMEDQLEYRQPRDSTSSEVIADETADPKELRNSNKKTTERVILASTPNTLEPFKSKMQEFIESATKTIDKLYKDLDESREMFIETMRFYHFTPKSRALEQCTPDQFYEYWTNFTNDFKEIATLYDDLLRKSKQIQTQSRKNVKTTKLKPGGLKERILRLSKK